jgi:hypothetical protein
LEFENTKKCGKCPIIFQSPRIEGVQQTLLVIPLLFHAGGSQLSSIRRSTVSRIY